MKRITSLLLVVILLISVTVVSSAASFDLSGMSLEELVSLKEKVTLAIWNSKDWQEVKVPAGMYQIGRDIPAGYWTIKPVEGDTAEVCWGTAVDDSGASIDAWNSDFYNFQQITSPSDSYAKYNNVESVSWQLREDDYLTISSSSVIFSPFAGHDLGFK